jgi:2-dehydro-3-deoxygluconokinase
MKKIITFGETMLRLSPPGNLRFSQATAFEAVVAGAESNVAVSLANYGLPVEFVSRLPENDLAEIVLREMRKYGVGINHLARGGERLGLYFLEHGASQRGGKVVYDRSHSSMATLRPGMIDWESAFDGAGWFHWSGITPAISQSAADACLEAIRVANRLGLTVSTDLNNRNNLWQYGKHPREIMPALTEGCDLILGAKEDAEKFFGLQAEGAGLDAYRSILKEIKKRFPRAKKVATTLRGSISASHNTWSGMLYDGETIFEAPTYDLTHIVDRVGGGDAFMGGLIYGLISYPADDQRALNFATAASALKHTVFGDLNLVTVQEVEALMTGDGSGRVKR